MYSKVKTLLGYKLHSLDGEIGKVKGFYFDDCCWTIRYLVAETGNWLDDRQVLISPFALAAVNEEKQYIGVALSKKQIEDSPPLETDKPVSRQFEESHAEYYGLPVYWYVPTVWGAYPYIERNPVKLTEFNPTEKVWDHHLRSTSVVSGYHIQALDGEIGHIDDFILDDDSWTIRYLVIDTQNWWPGKKVLISPRWIKSVDWDQSKVFVKLSREEIKNSPEYIEKSALTRDYEKGLHRHYNCEGYWVDEMSVFNVN